ncbi:hypothetical protein PN498_12130 [Oscillatoria sp. CS-180]|nr:hypothetical protein [Oscillatoria sp. CS-180]MDB9526739.1 hypothetical protein [Oscillatoria sp. CS-180]
MPWVCLFTILAVGLAKAGIVGLTIRAFVVALLLNGMHCEQSPGRQYYSR